MRGKEHFRQLLYVPAQAPLSGSSEQLFATQYLTQFVNQLRAIDNREQKSFGAVINVNRGPFRTTAGIACPVRRLQPNSRDARQGNPLGFRVHPSPTETIETGTGGASSAATAPGRHKDEVAVRDVEQRVDSTVLERIVHSTLPAHLLTRVQRRRRLRERIFQQTHRLTCRERLLPLQQTPQRSGLSPPNSSTSRSTSTSTPSVISWAMPETVSPEAVAMRGSALSVETCFALTGGHPTDADRALASRGIRARRRAAALPQSEQRSHQPKGNHRRDRCRCRTQAVTTTALAPGTRADANARLGPIDAFVSLVATRRSRWR